jgi:hypothetical protein
MDYRQPEKEESFSLLSVHNNLGSPDNIPSCLSGEQPEAKVIRYCESAAMKQL